MRASIVAGMVLAVVAPGAASAVTAAWVAANATPYISVQNAADLFNGSSLVNRNTQFTGVVGIQIRTNAQLLAGTASVCSGAVIGSNTVLTAGHCLAGDGSGIASVRVYLPDYNQPRAPSILASTFYIDPAFTGNVLQGADIGIIKLSKTVPVGTAIYAIDHGSVASNLGVEQEVALGTIGAGAIGDAGVQDGKKRTGFNEYEFTWSQVLAAAGFPVAPGSPVDAFGAPIDGFLASDFDSGLAVNDVFGRFLGTPGLGYVSPGGTFHDTGSTPGDSGAPHFENGKIVGLTSFGISGALFQGGVCGAAGSVDPSAAGRQCTNSSFGEIGVDTRVSAYYDYIASRAPEPATWAMMIGGFGLIGAVQRRRRATTITA